jgi:hypothetical protein
MKCARCHSHKYDPIPQRDYYRLLDTFKGAYDEHNWLKPDVRPGLGPISEDPVGGRLLPYVTTAERTAWEAHNARIRAQIDAVRATLGRQAEALASQRLDMLLAQLPEVLRDDLRVMLKTPPEKRDAVQRYLAVKFEKHLTIDQQILKKQDPAFKKAADEAEARQRSLEASLRPEPRIQALWDRGDPSPTYIYRRGDPLQPGRLVGPGVPSVLTDGQTPFEVKPPWPGARKTGRRLAFARWLVAPDQPLTARVAVNRLWKHHFGTGIVKTLGNFGKAGAAPTHPELLDWLARAFVRGNWDVKAMHRLMMTSTTYRQNSLVTPQMSELDRDNALLSRMPLQRLDAEALYDTLLYVAGRLDETPSGPADAVLVRPDGLVTPAGNAKGWRRLVYVQQTRKQIATHRENFDFPQMNPNCVERRDSTVVTQALYLLNNGMIDQLASAFAERVVKEVGSDERKQIQRISLIALSRPASAEEERIGLTTLNALTSQWAEHLAKAGKPDPRVARLRALTTYCHAIVNSAGFLYVD